MKDGTEKKFLLEEVETEIQEHYKRVVKMMKSFVMFDATIEGRFDQANANKVRFSDSTYDTSPLCSDKKTVRGFIQEVRGVMGGLAEQFGLGEKYTLAHELIPQTRAAEWPGQSTAIKDFNKQLAEKMNEYVEKEGIEKMASMLAGMNNLTGLIEKKTDRAQQDKELEEAQASEEKKQKKTDAGEAEHE